MWPFTRRYSKWEIYVQDQVMTRQDFNPVWGLGIMKTQVLVDIYVCYHKKTNIPKYKYVEKPFIRQTA